MNVAWIKYDPPGPFYIPPLVWGSKFCTCPRGHIGGPSAPQETYEWTTRENVDKRGLPRIRCLRGLPHACHFSCRAGGFWIFVLPQRTDGGGHWKGALIRVACLDHRPAARKLSLFCLPIPSHLRVLCLNVRNACVPVYGVRCLGMVHYSHARI